jgi:2-polyprenyl-3-methyl-5-hydroxy-6-metoxy-1,4-benzoquinol methylase
VITKEQFDKDALWYYLNAKIPDMHIEHTYQRSFVKWLKTMIPESPTQRVLEMGYGDGIITDGLIQHGCDVTLLEGSNLLIDEALKHHPGLKYAYSFFEEYTPISPFDVVVASHVLEHVDDPVSILKRMRQWVTPKGQVVVVVPNAESIHRQVGVYMGLQPRLDSLSDRDRTVGHQRVYSIDTLYEDIHKGGWRVVQVKGFFIKCTSNSYMEAYPDGLLEALNELSHLLPTRLLANIAVVVSVAI